MTCGGAIGNDWSEHCCTSAVETNGMSGRPVTAPAEALELRMLSTDRRNRADGPTDAPAVTVVVATTPTDTTRTAASAIQRDRFMWFSPLEGCGRPLNLTGRQVSGGSIERPAGRDKAPPKGQPVKMSSFSVTMPFGQHLNAPTLVGLTLTNCPFLTCVVTLQFEMPRPARS